MKKFGLIGRKLMHSFSGSFFAEKFEKEGITDCQYGLYELSGISELNKLLATENLKGFNVTIPYKKEVMEYLDEVDEVAQRIGAVNVVSVGRKTKGFNSDYFGFKTSLKSWLPSKPKNALILGNGGAAAAVKVALEDLEIPFKVVSRSSNTLNYNSLHQNPSILEESQLIINTTPLGTFPDIHQCPDLDYQKLTPRNYLYDLIYNPENTLFLKRGMEKGALVKNGLEMLRLQAEKSWKIWTEPESDL